MCFNYSCVFYSFDYQNTADRYGIIRVQAQDKNQVVVQSDDNDNTTKEFCFWYPSNVFTLPTEPENVREYF